MNGNNGAYSMAFVTLSTPQQEGSGVPTLPDPVSLPPVEVVAPKTGVWILVAVALALWVLAKQKGRRKG